MVRMKLAVALLTAISAFAQTPDFNEPYHLVREPGRKLELVLEGSTLAPNLKASRWIVVSAQPSDHGFHEVLSTRLEAWTDDPEDVQVAKPYVEESPDQRPMFRAEVPAGEVTDKLHYKLVIEIQATTTRLEPGRGKTRPPKLKSREKARLTARTDLHDYDSKRVQDWMAKHELERDRGESDLAFGYRVLDAIAEEMTYAFPPRFPKRLASQVIEECASDCGGLSALFVSVLRSNDIPARVLVGRWTGESQPEEPQNHVKAEFYADGVGWVPIDGSGAVSWKNGALDAFGIDRGKFVVMHQGAELVVDTKLFGKQNLTWCQGASTWASGSGDFSGVSYPSRWIVRPVEED